MEIMNFVEYQPGNIQCCLPGFRDYSIQIELDVKAIMSFTGETRLRVKERNNNAVKAKSYQTGIYGRKFKRRLQKPYDAYVWRNISRRWERVQAKLAQISNICYA